MRLFTAIDITPEIRKRLQAFVQPLQAGSKLRWSAPENLHITTKFIGEWPEARMEELTAVLAQVKVPSPIDVSLHGCGWYPNARNGRVFYAEIKAPGLRELAANTESALASIGVPVEDRDYSPHLTLARRKDRSPIPAFDADADFGSFRADSFSLYLSHGGKYTQLKEFSFL